MATRVFVAHADLYIGEQLRRQFETQPHLFRLYACTWDADAPRRLSEQAAAAASADGSDDEIDDAAASRRMPTASQTTMAPDAVLAASSTPHTPAPASPTAVSTTSAHPGPVTVSDPCDGDAFRTRYFWRGDIAAVREALLVCDWIVVVQRQSQEVLDMLHFLQQHPFETPKRLVLVSNFMTWYATPPLTAPPEVDATSVVDGDDDAEDETRLRQLYKNTATHDPRRAAEDDELDAMDVHDEDDPPVPAAEVAQKEVFTEDQYNRRVPHVRYYNWRDAEKAVAGAHHAHGLPLDTFVVFAGLAYGDGEDALQPFFRLAWSAGREPGLPIYGDGTQCVPMIHVRDLATFTRKLLQCPAAELPNPGTRYIFATDAATLSWRLIVDTINRAFGRTRRYETITADKFPLHHNVELFTLDVRVESETMAAIMDRPDPVSAAGQEESWVAREGMRVNVEKVAFEFCTRHKVTPLRLAVLGPPLVGKTSLCARLATHYRVPRFTLADIVTSYKAELQKLRDCLARYKAALEQDEVAWRVWRKRRRVWEARHEGESHGAMENDADGDEGRGGESESGALEGGPHTRDENVPEEDSPGGDEPTDAELELSADEVRAAHAYAEEQFESSARVERWRERIAQMERILLMRVRPRAVTPDANPKRRVVAPKKKLTKEQQRRKEEEDLQSAKEAIKDAPFQDRALALMVRWRLTRPDCRNQGYILDGDPQTVELARLCFASVGPTPPQTDEEALQHGGGGANGSATEAAGDEDDKGTDAANAKLPTEHMDERLLPDYVIVLKADENFLLDRLTAVQQLDPCPSPTPLERSAGSCDAKAGTASGTDGGVAAALLDRFHQQLSTFQQQFIERPYSLFDFVECAFTDPGDVLAGGRRAVMHVINAESLDGVRSYTSDAVEDGAALLEAEVRSRVGEGHHFGDTPLDYYRVQARKALIAEQQRSAQVSAENAAREVDAAAFREELAQRAVPDSALRDAKAADLRALEERKAPLYAELEKNVIPLLSKGLLEVCAHRPQDPTTYLAEWLLRYNPHSTHIVDL